MRYNWYLYWFSVQAIPITDIVKNGISATNIIADLIISTSLILSQKKSDEKLHPVVYASRFTTSPAEKCYRVTKLETLAVVWAVQHIRAYLYGHAITVITDYSAIKSILNKPSSNGKLA